MSNMDRYGQEVVERVMHRCINYHTEKNRHSVTNKSFVEKGSLRK